jgi:PAS domain S-box-containing protein
MQADQASREKRIKLAGIVSVFLLIGLICILLWENYASQVTLHGSALNQLGYDTEKLATAASYFYSERKDDLKDLAKGRELSIFFENKALGMSMEYGLRASLIAINKSFERLLNEKKFHGESIYTRIVFIDSNGLLLVDCQSLKNADRESEKDWKRYLAPDRSEPVIIAEHYGRLLSVAVSTPCFFKDRYVGQLAAWISPNSIYKYFVKTDDESSQRLYGIVCPEGSLHFEMTKNLIAPYDVRFDFGKTESWKPYRFYAVHSDGTKSEMITIRVPVKDTPFSLAVVTMASEVFGGIPPWQLPLAMGMLLVVILMVIAYLWRINARNERDLREREEKYRRFFETSRDCVFITSMDGRWIDMNDAAVELFGYADKDELRSLNVGELYENPEEREGYVRLLEQQGFVKELPVNFRRKDGGVINCLLTGVAEKGETGNITESQGTIKDITEHKRHEEERQRLETRLQNARKMEVLGTLAGGVAHDLNNVLGGIVSYPELLLMDLSEDSPLRKPLLTIQKSGEKAAAIIQDMLTLARRGVSTREVVNLNDIISNHLKTPEHEKLKLFHPGAKIVTNLEENLLNIMGSPVHLSQTVMNLISNAAEAMPDGGTIVVSTQNRYIDRPITGYKCLKEGDYVTLTISDTGIGIPAEDVERIFEPFYTKKVMGRSGTGLGMTVVWGTVEDHDGYIDIQNTEGKGTTFILSFPVTREKSAKDELLLSIEDYAGRGESILVVDDVEEQRKIASVMLKKLGYSVMAVSSGEEAVEYMQDHSADLLVLDMIMDPGIDGLETYEQILELHPDQKAIIASGFSESERVKEAQKLGAATYIAKPYLMKQIGIAVRNELDT